MLLAAGAGSTALDGLPRAAPQELMPGCPVAHPLLPPCPWAASAELFWLGAVDCFVQQWEQALAAGPAMDEGLRYRRQDPGHLLEVVMLRTEQHACSNAAAMVRRHQGCAGSSGSAH